MNVHEACSLLGVQVGASVDDVKSAFKKMAAKYHPDRNKDEGAEDHFKQINSAYQFLEKNGTNPPIFNDVASPFYSSGDHLAEELRRQMSEVFFHQNFVNISGPPIIVRKEIPFETSVLGGQTEIVYTRTVKCSGCLDGKTKIKCPKCNGLGRRKYGIGPVTPDGSASPEDNRELPCNGCKGTGFATGAICGFCNGTSKKKTSESIWVTIPPGITEGARITLKGLGNYRAKDIYDNLIISIGVLPSDKGLTLSGADVISTVELSLLEALKGTKKELYTVKGNKVLEFKPKIRNGDRVRVSGFGVGQNGAHVFVVSVNYPEDVSEIINVLENHGV